MKHKTINNQASISSIVNEKFIIEELTIQQLINLAIDLEGEVSGLHSRQELINRGKDNIYTRITIKKVCKTAISELESLLKKVDLENITNKETIKSYKNKFLTSISILDKLQLEWQKYDLSIKH